MDRRQAIAVGSLVWAVTGAVIALSALATVNAEVAVLVAVASVAFPLAAVGAALSLRVGRDRLAGALLLLSVATPTYFAYIFNLPALVVGLALLIAPAATVGVPPGHQRVRSRDL